MYMTEGDSYWPLLSHKLLLAQGAKVAWEFSLIHSRVLSHFVRKKIKSVDIQITILPQSTVKRERKEEEINTFSFSICHSVPVYGLWLDMMNPFSLNLKRKGFVKWNSWFTQGNTVKLPSYPQQRRFFPTYRGNEPTKQTSITNKWTKKWINKTIINNE